MNSQTSQSHLAKAAHQLSGTFFIIRKCKFGIAVDQDHCALKTQ